MIPSENMWFVWSRTDRWTNNNKVLLSLLMTDDWFVQKRDFMVFPLIDSSDRISVTVALFQPAEGRPRHLVNVENVEVDFDID